MACHACGHGGSDVCARRFDGGDVLVACDAFNLAADVLLMVECQVTHRGDRRFFRRIAVVTELAVVGKLVFVTALAHIVAGNDLVGQLLVARDFLVACDTFGAGIDMELMREF